MNAQCTACFSEPATESSRVQGLAVEDLLPLAEQNYKLDVTRVVKMHTIFRFWLQKNNFSEIQTYKYTKLVVISRQANYTDRSTAGTGEATADVAGRRCYVVTQLVPTADNLGVLDRKLS
jgi:hypothetical protein